MLSPTGDAGPLTVSADAADEREPLLALGRSRRPWGFVPAALAAIGSGPDDPMLRLLLAANYGWLGLRTAAMEELDRLVADHPPLRPDIDTLRTAIATLPADRMDSTTRRARAEAAVDALAARGIDLASAAAGWSTTLETTEWFTSIDGNVVARPTASPRRWSVFGDLRSPATHVQVRADDGNPTRVVYLDGLEMPWLLTHLMSAVQRNAHGWCPAIVVVEADANAFLDAVTATENVATALADHRVRCFIGSSALDDLAQDLDNRLGYRVDGLCLQSRRREQNAPGPVQELVRSACEKQSEEVALRRERLRCRYAARTLSWWARRYRDAAADGPPMRVLIPTSRYSTYVQHASADIAAAIRSNGCEARVVIEPDDTSWFGSLAHLRAFEDLDPDLVVLVNYTRRATTDIPENIPVATWVQDPMPHLSTREAWGGHGPLDFVYGHALPKFAERFGIDRARMRFSLVPASTEKFHPGPVDDTLARAFTCDIAVAMNSGETPQQCRDRLLEAARGDAIARAVIEELEPDIREIVDTAWETSVMRRLRAITTDAVLRHRGASDDVLVDRLLDRFVYPLADRLFRHATVAWAVEVAETHDRRLHLYGRGWDDHPAWARFARGVVPHGDTLRAAYQCATVHLHASIHGPRHQRVIECALSGGLPLTRRTFDELRLLRQHTSVVVSTTTDPVLSLRNNRSAWCRAIDHPASRRLNEITERLGLPARPYVYYDADARDPDQASSILPDEIMWLLGDPTETSFANRGELERLVLRAVDTPAWRAGVSASIAERARAHLTYEACAPDLLDLVRSSITSDGATGP